MSPLVALPVFGAALVITLLSARLFARRLDALGVRFGLPEALIGLLTALAADGPEISSALFASAKGAHAVSIGVIVGSNVFNLAAMIGITGMLTGAVVLTRETLLLEGVTGGGVLVIAAAVLLHAIAPLYGVVLCACVLIPYVVVIVGGAEFLARRRSTTAASRVLSRALAQRPRTPVSRLAPSHAMARVLLLIALDVLLIIGGSAVMVQSALDLGADWHVSQAILATLVLAPLTSVPNAVTGVRLGMAGRGAALVSETFNSNTINLAVGVIVPALFIAFASLTTTAVVDVILLVVMTAVCSTSLASRRGLQRSGACCLLVLYACFVVVQLSSG